MTLEVLQKCRPNVVYTYFRNKSEIREKQNNNL